MFARKNSKKQKSNKIRLKAERIYKIKKFIATLPYHFLVIGGVAVISFIFNKWFEATCFLISFFSLRYKFPTTYHAKSIVICMVLTNSIFALSIILCPYANSYIFGSLVFGYLDTFILWYIQSKDNLKQDKECAEKIVIELKQRLISYENPLEILKEKCRNAKLSKRDTEIAIKYFYEKQTPKEIWLWLCDNKEYDTIEWDSVYRLLIRIGNKLNIKQKTY